ncbi:MAG: hypothetical protein O3C40_24880 [Planctomycetota bacterium]|nr:hypothetical protein [Planctomycetota bacterium]
MKLTLKKAGYPDIFGYFDETRYYTAKNEPPPAETRIGKGVVDNLSDLVVTNARGTGLPIRSIPGDTEELIALDEILEGSVEWVTQDELTDELAFTERVAESVATKICVPVAPVLRSGARGVAWVGSTREVPPPGTQLRLLRAGASVFVTSENQAGDYPAVPLTGDVEWREQDVVALADLPPLPPRILFSTVPSGQDSESSKLNHDIFKALSAVGVRCTVGELKARDLENQAFLRSQVDDQVTHIFHSKFDDDPTAPGHFLVRCWLSSLTDDESGRVSRDDDSVGDASLAPVDIFHRRSSFSPLPPLMTGQLYYIDFKSVVVTKSDDRTFRRVCGRGHTICQLVDDSDETHMILRWIPDQSLHSVPKASIDLADSKPLDSLDPSNLENYNDLIFLAACGVAQRLCPPAGIVDDVGDGIAQTSLGRKQGIERGMRLRVIRPGKPDGTDLEDRRPRLIGVVRVRSEPEPTSSDVDVPTDVILEKKDVVFPHAWRRGVHVLVAPLEPDNQLDVYLKGRAMEITRDIAEELDRLGIPLVVSKDELEKIDSAVDGRGIDKTKAAAYGRRFGATHVLSGTISPAPRRPGSEKRAILRFELTNVEEGTTRPIGDATGQVHVNLDQEYTTPAPKRPGS